MKLHEFHVLQGQPGTQRHRVAVTGAGMCRRTREEGTPVAAGRQQDLVRAESVQSSSGEIDRDDTAARAVLHHKVDGEVLDVELGIVLERLLVKRVQHRMAGAVGCCAGSLRRAFTEVRGHATERTLVNAAVFGA